MKLALFALAAGLSLTACSTMPVASHADVTRDVFKSAAIEQRVMTAPTVTASRVHWRGAGLDSIARHKRFHPYKLASYQTVSTVTLTVEQASSVRQRFAAPSSYGFNMTKGCIPEYGVVFTFNDGHQPIRVALCFKCLLVAVFDGSTAVNVEDDFDPMYHPLAHLSKQLFPKDPELQRLK